jgi:predicted amidophosphoribosyltransferase
MVRYTEYDPQSPYVDTIEKRQAINNLCGWGQIPKKLPWCSKCKGKRYLLKENNYYCSNCGYETPTTAVQQEMEKDLKHGPNTGKNPLIVSQTKKKKRSLYGYDEETEEDLKSLGFSGATLKDYSTW